MHGKISVPEVCLGKTFEQFKGVNGRLDATMANSEKTKQNKTERKVETFPLCLHRH